MKLVRQNFMTDSNDNFVCSVSTIGTFTLTAAQGGQSWAMAKLCDVYRGRIQCWVYQEGVRGTDADDIRQNVVVSVLRSLKKFQRKSASQSLAAWVRHITKRRSQDYYRGLKASKLTYYTGEHIDRFGGLAIQDDSYQPEAWSTKVREAMAHVEAESEVHNWQAFCRTVLDENSASDVAKELGITVNMVYLAKSRILKRLRELLK
jgi:RNA polymerase sigma-70 factor (ECF subfamily)